MTLTPDVLRKVSKEETRRMAFTHPGVQVLRTQLSAVQARVPGTDES